MKQFVMASKGFLCRLLRLKAVLRLKNISFALFLIDLVRGFAGVPLNGIALSFFPLKVVLGDCPWRLFLT